MSNVECKHILLVEDDEVDQENIKREFKKKSTNNMLSIAYDGYEAYGMLMGQNGFQKLDPAPHILLLDINMPRLNGLELLKKIRVSGLTTPLVIFIFTTSENSQDIQEAYELGVAGYILKPLNNEKFSEIISILDNYWSLLQYPE